jgi:tetratricopeptide (TPR) repeat protein
LNLAAGETGAALRYAEEARATDPKSPAARVALVRSLLATGNLARAESEINLLLKGAPGAAEVHTLNGLLMVRKKDAAAARRSFERALELSPGYLDALGGLTYLDLTGKSAAQAIARLESELAKRPNEAPLLALASSAYISAGNLAKAEQLLRKAVSDNPNFISGYGKLAQLYMQQGRLDEARVEYEGMVKRDPSSSSARTMVGVLFEAQGRREEARKSYEATVSATDKAPLAANNLAFIYAEQGTNLDIALQLATSAKQQLPNDPEVDDTIGWIYYKKNQPSLAVRPLEASVTKLPGSAEVLYHLGLTYAKIGDKEKARDTLQRALKLDPNVGGGEARRVLETVSR